ncbi:MAG: HpsJ family protein [Verrucomicrobiota bacterium]
MPRRSSASRKRGDNEPAGEPRYRLRAEAMVDMQAILFWVGVIFLVFGGLNYLFFLAPFDFMNPLWEIRFFGQVVDQMFGPLIGLALILTPFSNNLSLRLLKIRAALSWLALALAIGYALLLPFGIITGNRIYNYLNSVRDNAFNEREVAMQVAMDELNEMRSVDEIRRRTVQLELKESIYAEPELERLKGVIGDKFRQLQEERMETVSSNYDNMVKSLAITTAKGVTGSIIAVLAFSLLFFKARSYRTLLHQDKLGKGDANGRYVSKPGAEENTG